MKVIQRPFYPLLAAFWLSYIPFASGQSSYTASDFAVTPPFLTDATDPFVMIDLSVELTQQAEAYTDAQQTYFGGTACPGRSNFTVNGNAWNNFGVCYSFQEEYLGYFDPRKCYVYDTSGADASLVQTSGAISTTATPHHFRPVGFVTDAENNNYSCSGSDDWSGHFLNWATMTALDQFRAVMTGGARILDQGPNDAVPPRTLLTRAHRFGAGSWPFVGKAIAPAGITGFSTTLTDVVPDTLAAGNSRLFFGNDDFPNNQLRNQVDIYDEDGSLIDEYNVIVEVCNATVGLEENCREYTDGTNAWYKPEGKIQQNAQQMRFALMTYTGESGSTRNGGVLRANAKYVGNFRPVAGGGIEVNPQAEIDAFGRFVFHPDLTDLTDDGENLTGVSNSGVINYINQFALGSGRYKSIDPFSELYYESLRYFMNAGRTDAYADGLAVVNKDDFPVITNVWDDPIEASSSCQANYIIAVGDQFMHRDGDIPGAHPNAHSDNAAAVAAMTAVEAAELADLPASWDLDGFTNLIGNMERGDTDLGQSFMQQGTGNDPGPNRGGRYNTFYVAGMAYYAKTQDMRPDLAGEQTIKTFVVDTQEYKANPPTTYQNALWMAAKYGGFEEIEDSTQFTFGGVSYPDPNDSVQGQQTDEWDADNDGVPDTYTLATQPQRLQQGLDNAFNDISTNLRSSSSAGVVSGQVQNQSLIIQALFKSEESNDDGDRIEWLGIVQSLFIKSFPHRDVNDVDLDDDTNDVVETILVLEDTDFNNVTSEDDLALEFVVDQASQSVTVHRHSIAYNGFPTREEDRLPPVLTRVDTVSIEELRTVWNVRDELANVSNYVTQRDYDTLSNNGRYIFTSLDGNHDGMVIPGSATSGDEVVPFTTATFGNLSSGTTGNNFRYLGLDSGSGDTAENIVNFIRGDESIPGYRSRSIDRDGDGVEEPWLLGDVITSSPVVAAAPPVDDEKDYFDLYRDNTFSEYEQDYRNRRVMTYFGANDGMLRGINGGFGVAVDEENSGFSTQSSVNSLLPEHPLGAELWAYVPSNVLPHLQWLTQLDYPHVYYVDGIPQLFDVNIFTPSDTHPGGWGTILVVGLRFGGGEFSFDPDSDYDADTSDDYKTRSSYIILDVTNPEVPPELIAEITHPQMGYATTRPAIVKSRNQDDNGVWSNNGWWLVFGSGPYGDDQVTRSRALTDGVSNQTPKVFVFDLLAREFDTFGGGIDYIDLASVSNVVGFTGDFVAADWDLDYQDDAVYFGTITGTPSNAGGNFYQLEFSSNSASITPVFSDVDRPFSGLAHVEQQDASGQNWLFTGTGRFYVPEDNLTAEQQGYYGLHEPYSILSTGASIAAGNLADVTHIDAGFVAGQRDGPIFDRRTNAAPNISVNNQASTPSSFSQLVDDIADGSGWRLYFDSDRAKHVGKTAGVETTVAFTEYVSTDDACLPLGTTFLNQVHFGTGTAAPFAASQSITQNNLGQQISDRREVFSLGLIRDAVASSDGGLVIGIGGAGDPAIETIGGIDPSGGRASWREIIINWE